MSHAELSMRMVDELDAAERMGNTCLADLLRQTVAELLIEDDAVEAL